MRKTKISNKIRKLEETSWLSQIIADKMEIEFNTNGSSSRYNCLNTFKIIVNEADNYHNDTIYYDNHNGVKSIIICNIPSFIEKHGTDFDKEGMQCKLRGLAERYKDDEGTYLVSVLNTHDLNSATINDVSELLFQISK